MSSPKIKKLLERAGGRPRYIPPRDYDHLFKLKIIGDSGSGKSSLVRQFLDKTFTLGACLPIDRDFVIQKIVIGGKSIQLQISEDNMVRFRQGGPGPYAGAQGVIIMYDVTDLSSFANLEQWLFDVERYACKNVNKLLVGNKCDLTTTKVVDFDTAKQFANERDIPLLEASCKTSADVEEVFTFMAEEILKRTSTSVTEMKPDQSVISPGKKKRNGKCTTQ